MTVKSAHHVDLLVIGGGINGCGIAADAAGRGLSVLLCDQGDLASQTSSWSSKLIHGGLRYLEFLEFGLVRESLTEQANLLHNAPHLVRPQRFIIPHCPWLRKSWLIHFGLFLYDHLSFKRYLPRSSSFHIEKELKLKENFKKGFYYYDCQVDDSRLVYHVAKLAALHNATIKTYCKVEQAKPCNEVWQCQLIDTQSNITSIIYAKTIVNATGPWVKQVTEEVFGIQSTFKLQLVKGSHIVVPKLFQHQDAFLLQNNDKRVVFVTPYLDRYSLIGTTDIPMEQPENSPTISPEEISYLCKNYQDFFDHSLDQNLIKWHFSGIRALRTYGTTAAPEISRDYAIEVHDQNIPPLICIYGGKITTYRKLAENVCNRLKKYFKQPLKPWTSRAYLPGGNFSSSQFDDFVCLLKKQFDKFPIELLRHYVKNYGTNAEKILDNAQTTYDLGHHYGHYLFEKEIDYLKKEEWAKTLEDVLWRRTKYGLFLSPKELLKLKQIGPLLS